MAFYPRGPGTQRNGAQNRFSFPGPRWNIPKPKSLFFVEFASTQVQYQELEAISFFVTRTDRPSFTFEVEEANQYNKRRLYYKKIRYNDISMTFWDTADSAALRVLTSYRDFYYGDFQEKRTSSWAYDQVSGETYFEVDQGYGYQLPKDESGTTPDRNDMYFFSRITLYEFYGGRYTVYNLINPKITALTLGEKDITTAAGTEITIQLQYEGLTHTEPDMNFTTPLIGADLENRLDLVHKFGLVDERFEYNQVGREIPVDGLSDPSLWRDPDTGIIRRIPDRTYENSSFPTTIGGIFDLGQINTIEILRDVLNGRSLPQTRNRTDPISAFVNTLIGQPARLLRQPKVVFQQAKSAAKNASQGTIRGVINRTLGTRLPF